MAETLLIVEDEEGVAGLLATILEAPGREIVLAATCATARTALADRDPLVVLLDINLPDGSGLDLLGEVIAPTGRRVAVMLSGVHDQESVVTAMRRGAMDYVPKPFANDDVRTKVAKAFDLARTARAATPADAAGGAPVLLRQIVGSSPAMFELSKLIGRIAGADLPVLIRGESGTGKELVARALHRHGARPGGPFVAVDCGGIPAGLLEGEMFGYERGAFTGAVAAKPGRFEMADGGTLFLDEISNLPLELQAKLLRALQEKTTQRLGSTQSRAWNARVVSASNADLRAQSAAGKFREDLMFRLAGVELALPALRDRIADLPQLVAHFLARHPGPQGARSVSPEALALLSGWPWPGNVRELEHVIGRAAALARGPVIGVEDLPDDLRAGRLPTAIPGITGPGGRDGLVTLEEVKRRYARHVLEACGGRKAEAARLLDIDPKTLNTLLGS